MSSTTARDQALLPVTRLILDDMVILAEGPITYGEFAKRAERLSGIPVHHRHVGRMLHVYAASLPPSEADHCHLVVNAASGGVGAGYADRRRTPTKAHERDKR